MGEKKLEKKGEPFGGKKKEINFFCCSILFKTKKEKENILTIFLTKLE